MRSDKKRVVNTAEREYMPEALRGRNPGAILQQEARGQQQAVNSDQLPTKGLIGPTERPIWEAMGVKIVEAEPGTTSSKDPMFTDVEMPRGWKKRPTDHSMWNEVVDEKGRVRARFFYKAAFYDRSAYIRFERRFTVQRNFDGPREQYENEIRVCVYDSGTIVHTLVEKKQVYKEHNQAMYQANEDTEKRLLEECVAWLVEQGYPDHESFTAYWD